MGICAVSLVLKLLEPVINSSPEHEQSTGKSMIEHAKQWYLMSAQDKNAQSKHEHISYASAYLNAARHILNDMRLERISGIDVHELQKSIDEMKNVTTREIFRQCPRLKQQMPHAATVALPKKKASWM